MTHEKYMKYKKESINQILLEPSHTQSLPLITGCFYGQVKTTQRLYHSNQKYSLQQPFMRDLSTLQMDNCNPHLQKGQRSKPNDNSNAGRTQ